MTDKLLDENKLTEEAYIKNYEPNKYPKASYTVDNLIFTLQSDDQVQNRLPRMHLKLLMIKRKNHPDLGQWALPGGFIDMNENLEVSAARELYEETGLNNVYLEQLYTYGDVNRDKRDRIISTAFLALVNNEFTDLNPGDDAADAKWFSVHLEALSKHKLHNETGYIYEKTVRLSLISGDIKISSTLRYMKAVDGKLVKRSVQQDDSNGIAFDHGKIILNGIDRLKNKIEYTDIVFNLLPELFTLSELQQVYELILEKQYSKSNFQRKFKHLITETKEVRSGKGYRPAALYKFNPQWDE